MSPPYRARKAGPGYSGPVIKSLPLTPLGVFVGLGVLTVAWAMGSPSGRTFTLGAYGTDLLARTPHQSHNARLAAAALDGAVIAPHGIFSFNHRVGGWTADRGYLPAPVSYNGLLVDACGGGVCETSTTLYNAALLAGLNVPERHQHSFAPGYIPPGRDAAVAYENIDLRLQNPYPWPVTIRAGTDGHMLVCRLEAAHPLPVHTAIYTQVLDRFSPAQAIPPMRPGLYSSRWRVKGRDGLRVLTLRTITGPGSGVRRELLSDNTYLPMTGL